MSHAEYGVDGGIVDPGGAVTRLGQELGEDLLDAPGHLSGRNSRKKDMVRRTNFLTG